MRTNPILPCKGRWLRAAQTEGCHPSASFNTPPPPAARAVPLPHWGRILGLALLTLTTPLAQAQSGPPSREDRRGPPGQSYANSSAVLVAEIAFARLAQDEGQWTAFRETASDDALMFVPQATLAQAWLKGRADPAQAVKWQPHKLFMACDGRTGASTGSSQFPGGATGYYTTVWQNLEKPRAKKPDWKWVLDHGALLKEPRAADDMISSRTAVCTGNPKAALGDIPFGPPRKGEKSATPATSGARASADGTMVWRWEVRSDGSRTISIDLWNGSSFDNVVRDDVPAEAA